MKSRIVQPSASFQPPDTCTEHDECQAAQASIADLQRNALDHYDKVSTAAREWHSVIPKAIAAYFDKPLEAENAATSMRSRCIEKAAEMEQRYREDAVLASNGNDNINMLILLHKATAAIEIKRALESVTIQEQEAKQS